MKKALSLAAAAIFALALLLQPEAAADGVRQGLDMCVGSVIPSLFPLFAATGLLVRLEGAGALQHLAGPVMEPLFRLRGICALPLLTGLVGGYPTGARAAAELHREGSISQEEAEVLLGFCNNCGPAFILSFVGVQTLQNRRAGMALYAIHVLAALITGMILCRWGHGAARKALPCRALKAPLSPAAAFTAAVTGAVSSTAGICAYVVLFQTLTALLPLPEEAMGALEMVGAIAALSPGRRGFVAAAGILGWGGLCVHCQTMAAAEGLSMKRHLVGKALQAVLSMALAAVWCRII